MPKKKHIFQLLQLSLNVMDLFFLGLVFPMVLFLFNEMQYYILQKSGQNLCVLYLMYFTAIIAHHFIKRYLICFLLSL